MLDYKQLKEFKEIQKKVLDAIKIDKSIKKIKTIGAIDIIFSEKDVFCAIALFDYKTLQLLEYKTTKSKEITPYSPNINPIRAGIPMVNTYKELEIKPDVILVSGQGAIHPTKIGEASYLGVMVNKPTIGITKILHYGRQEEEKIYHKNEHKGFILKTKDISNPIYIVPGYKIEKKQAKEIVEKCIKNHKMPEPLHVVHKIANKLKKKSKN